VAMGEFKIREGLVKSALLQRKEVPPHICVLPVTFLCMQENVLKFITQKRNMNPKG